MRLSLQETAGLPSAPFKSSFEIQDQLKILAAGCMVGPLVFAEGVKALGLVG